MLNNTKQRSSSGRQRVSVGTMLAGVGVATALTLASSYTALAAPGDQSNATGQFLGGSLLGFNEELLLSLGGESAHSDGTVDVTNADNLNVGALGTVDIDIPGGIQIPLNLGEAGVVSQYASALANASSVGASGLTAANGDIGNGITPAPGIAPGPLNVNLGEAVAALSSNPNFADFVDELAELDVEAGIMAARAAQAAPNAATGSYDIDDLGISFNSATLGSLTEVIDGLVTQLQSMINGLSGASGSLATVLETLINMPGLLTVSATVDPINVQNIVAPLIAGDITAPGVSINLAAGSVFVDLGALIQLNGLPPNTDILLDSLITQIGDSIGTAVSNLAAQIISAVETAYEALGVSISVDLTGDPDNPVLGVDSTVGQLLSGSTSGITVAGGLIGVITPDLVVNVLIPPLQQVVDVLEALTGALTTPVQNNVIAALEPILSTVLRLTVNVQSLNAGVFSETALRIQIFPNGIPNIPTASAALAELDIANATVGVDALAGGGGGIPGGGHGGLASTGLDLNFALLVATLLVVTAGGALTFARRRNA